MSSVLFIDDDSAILRVNRVYFESRSYRVYTAESREQAERVLGVCQIDCIVLDILMPGVDGWALCQKFKAKWGIPIIFLTSLTEQDCLYRGFELGADDYMTKPYDLRELEMRVTARIRQYEGATSPELLSFPPLVIDADGRRALVNGKIISLTAYEFDILLLLARSPGKVFSMAAIYCEIWKLPDLGNAQTVRVHLARMRHKLETACPDRCFIELVWGKGFLFLKELHFGAANTPPTSSAVAAAAPMPRSA